MSIHSRIKRSDELDDFLVSDDYSIFVRLCEKLKSHSMMCDSIDSIKKDLSDFMDEIKADGFEVDFLPALTAALSMEDESLEVIAERVYTLGARNFYSALQVYLAQLVLKSTKAKQIQNAIPGVYDGSNYAEYNSYIENINPQWVAKTSYCTYKGLLANTGKVLLTLAFLGAACLFVDEVIIKTGLKRVFGIVIKSSGDHLGILDKVE